jgi:ethanolamine permease
VGLNIAGASVSFRATLGITVLALGILVVFWLGALPHVAISHALDIAPVAAADGSANSAFLPHGPLGVLTALPFAIWFFLGIEELPLAAEEAVDPVRDVPRALGSGLLTLVIAAFLTLGLNSAIPPGAAALSTSQEPLLARPRDHLRRQRRHARARAGGGGGPLGQLPRHHLRVRPADLLALAGWLLPARALAHAQDPPHPARGARSWAPLLGFAVAYAIRALGTDSPVGAVLLNMAVFGAVLSYVLQMASYLLLLRRLSRPRRGRTAARSAWRARWWRWASAWSRWWRCS